MDSHNSVGEGEGDGHEAVEDRKSDTEVEEGVVMWDAGDPAEKVDEVVDSTDIEEVDMDLQEPSSPLDNEVGEDAEHPESEVVDNVVRPPIEVGEEGDTSTTDSEKGNASTEGEETSDEDQPVLRPRSSRLRKPREKFSYDELGGNPVNRPVRQNTKQK